MPIDRGYYYSKGFQFKTRSDGQPVDISSWQFAADLKDEDDETVLTMTTGGGHFTVTDGANGEMTFALSVAETQALEAGPVSFVVKRTDDTEHGDIRLFRATELVRDEG